MRGDNRRKRMGRMGRMGRKKEGREGQAINKPNDKMPNEFIDIAARDRCICWLVMLTNTVAVAVSAVCYKYQTN